MEYLTVLIALLALYIAYRQFCNDKYQTRIDLYEKRRAVYLSIGEILARCITSIHTKEDPFGFKLAWEVGRTQRESKFLFNRKLTEQIEEILNKVSRMSEITRQLNPIEGDGEPIGEKRNQLAEEKRELMLFFSNTLKNLESMFIDQMGLNK